jgi:hypothetical protein
LILIRLGTKKAFETKEAAGRGELNIDAKRSSPILGGMLNRNRALGRIC